MRKVSMLLLLLSIVSLAAAVPAEAQGLGGTVVTRLRGFEEVPAVSTPGGGVFTATINEEGTEMEWELTYCNIEGNVTQAHLHYAQRGVNGGIFLFLCSNLGNGPAGTQNCPAKGGTISGTATAANILPVTAQSLGGNDLLSALRGIRGGVVYVNVHTDLLPGGSIRGQLNFTSTP